LAIFRVGDGESTLFWTDRWIDGRSAGDIAPEVTSLVPTRRRNSRKVREALQEEAWLSDIVGDLSIDGWMQCTLFGRRLREFPGMKVGRTSLHGGDRRLASTPPERHTTCYAKGGYLGPWQSRFGGRLHRLSAKSLDGWLSDTGSGLRIGGPGMVCKTIRIPVLPVCRRRTLLIIFFRIVRTPKWFGLDA
jgi:hypothetical protein